MAYISQYPPAQNDTYVKATSQYGVEYAPYLATDPTKSLIDAFEYNGWISTTPESPQRFHIDLGTAKIITRIYYENMHGYGTDTAFGVRYFTLWGSNDSSAFNELTYGTDTSWTQLATGSPEFDIHSELNEADPKYILVTNTVAYRYYAFKFSDDWGGNYFMGVRRIELQTGDSGTIQKTINSNSNIKLTAAQKTIASDAKIIVQSQKTITSDAYIRIPSQKTINSAAHIKTTGAQKTITSDASIVVRVNLSFISNLITKITNNTVIQTILDVILNRSDNHYDTKLTTRYKVDEGISTNLTTKLVSYESITPKSLNDIIVYKDGVELTDVDYSTLKIQLNLNSTPSNATFTLARRHDDLDHNILGASSIITAQNKITIYDGTIKLFTGYISKISPNSGTDTVNIIAEDIRCKIAQITVKDMYYGGYTEDQIEDIEDELDEEITVYFTISSAIAHVLSVAGLSGSVPGALIPEPTLVTDNCCALLDTLIGGSINANWYIDANENFQLQYVASGSIKTLPLSGLNTQRGIYEVILNDINLNKLTADYTPSLYVKLGKYLNEAWTSYTYMGKNYYLTWNSRSGEFYSGLAQEQIADDINRIKSNISKFAEPQIFVRQKGYYVGGSVNLDSYFVDSYHSWGGEPTVSVIYMAQYKSYTHITDITPIVIGSGSPQKILDLSQFGKKASNAQLVVDDGWLKYRYQEEYDYTAFATDYANFVLSQNNKLITEAQITLILDAYEYYGIILSDLINLSNTTVANIYNNTNGFPLNISGIAIDCATRIVTLSTTNYGKTFYQRSGNYLTNYKEEHFKKLYREYEE